MKVKNKIIKFVDLWLPVILWALIIFRFSSGAVPQVSTRYWPNFAFMKGAHSFFYGILSLLFYRALTGEGINRKKSAIWAVLLSVFYGMTDEFHQMFTQGREARVRDILFDGLGAGIVVYLVYQYILKLPKRIREILLKIGIK